MTNEPHRTNLGPEAPRIAVIGAGSSGLAVAKNLKQAGLRFECLERESELGGNWCYGKPNSSIYRSTHLISSKNLTEYTDFPMPEAYPDYPRHDLVLKYLRDYAERFGLPDHLQFNVGVRRAERAAEGWKLELDSGETRRYTHLVIANGHNWKPRLPDIPGVFNGQQLHSCEYKTPDVLTGKRVLVVGGGNSGCDIAVESAEHAAKTYLSLRRGYHFLPKYFHGAPIDVCGERGLRWRVPLGLRRWYAAGVSWFVLGSARTAGFPKPDHRLFEAHPVISSRIVDAARHGDIDVVPNATELNDDKVKLADGSEIAIDLIVYATGFQIAFPFIDNQYLNWHGGKPNLYLNVFHPGCDDLFVAGLIQPDSGQFGLVDEQAKCIAAYISGLANKHPGATRFQEAKGGEPPSLNSGLRYLDSPRHLVEVEHYRYRKLLRKLHKQLSL